MTHHAGRAEFFAREAGEYLGRLTQILGDDPPASDEFVRFARALRGAAMMAGPAGFARAAGVLEDVAKAVRDRRLGWDATVARQVRLATERFQVLAERSLAWGNEERGEIQDLTQRLESLGIVGASGGRPRTTLAAPAQPASPSVAAFIRDQTRQIGTVLHALGEHCRTEWPRDAAFHTALDALQPLRGLAPDPQYQEMALVLESLQALLTDLIRGYPPPSLARMGEVLEAGSRALDQAASGSPGFQTLHAGVSRFGDLLYQDYAQERDVVPIEHLADETPLPGTPEVGASSASEALDLVSLGDRLRQAATQLADAPATVHPFYLYALAATIRSLPEAVSAPPAGASLRAILQAIRDGRALDAPELFTQALRAIALPLTEAMVLEPDDLARDVALATTLLRPPRPVPSPAPEASSTPSPAVPVPFPEVEAMLAPIVPIESLLLPEGAEATGRSQLERSFGTLHRLRLERASYAAGAAPPVGRPIVPIVPIEDLLYRGAAARERIGTLRRELVAQAGATANAALLLPLVEEIADLVPLALDQPA